MNSLEDLMILLPLLNEVVAPVEEFELATHDLKDHNDILIFNGSRWEHMSIHALVDCL